MTDLSAEALTCFARIDQNPQDSAAWSDLLYALVVGPAPEDVWAAIPLLAQRNQNRVGHVVNLARNLVDNGRASLLDLLLKNSPPSDPFFSLAPIFEFYAGRNSHILRYDLPLAYEHYLKFIKLFPFERNFAGLNQHEYNYILSFMHSVFIMIYALDGSKDIDSYDLHKDDLISLPEGMPENLIVMACCDNTYFLLYAEQFLETNKKFMGKSSCFIHIINPDTECMNLAVYLTEKYKNFMFSCETHPINIPYYAARRFMVANQIRKHYGCDILILDIDLILTDKFAQDIERIRSSELALRWFTSSVQMFGNGVFEAALFASAHSPVADVFFERTHAWFHGKLAKQQEFWHWDSYGLHYGLSKLGDMRTRVLNLWDLWPEEIGKVPYFQEGKHVSNTSTDKPSLVQDVLSWCFNPTMEPQPFRLFLP